MHKFEIVNNELVKYEGYDAVVEIPEGVVKIGEDAFKGNAFLTELVMPDTVITIGSSAFRNCRKLKKIVKNLILTIF